MGMSVVILKRLWSLCRVSFTKQMMVVFKSNYNKVSV